MATVDPASSPAHPEDLRMDRLPVNVGEAERWLSLIGGGALAAIGLKQRSVLGLAIAGVGGALLLRGATGHCPLYHAAGIDTASEESGATVPYGRGIRVEESVTIHRTAAELYPFWRRLENLPRFMHHLESVTQTGEKRSHWVAKAPAGMCVEWDAEIINEVPDELIAWKSLDEADVDHAGSVHFEPSAAGRGTQVHVILRYDPPAGKIGAAFARLFGEDPSTQIAEDLRRFKQLIEAGEVATTEGQPAARA